MQNIMPIRQFFVVALAVAALSLFGGCWDSPAENSPAANAVANSPNQAAMPSNAPETVTQETVKQEEAVRQEVVRQEEETKQEKTAGQASDRRGVLEFRIAPTVGGGGNFPFPGGVAEAQRLQAQLVREGPDAGRERSDPWLWFPARSPSEKFNGLVTQVYDGKVYVLLANSDANMMLNPPGARTWRLDDARIDFDVNNDRPLVAFTFDPRGGKLFATLTAAHKGNFLAILVDNEVYSVPRINDVISQGAHIRGNFTEDDAEELAAALRGDSMTVDE